MSGFTPSMLHDWLQELTCMFYICRDCWWACTSICQDLHTPYCGYFLFEVGASNCFRENESDRESMLKLLCRVFITLRGSTLIMHEYTVPPTSQHLTGGERRSSTAKWQRVKDTKCSLWISVSHLSITSNSNLSKGTFVYLVIALFILSVSIKVHLCPF